MVRRFAGLLFVLLWCLSLALPVAATDPAAVAGSGIEQEYRDYLDSLPPEVVEVLPLGVFPEGEKTDFGSVAEAVADMTSFSYLFGLLGEALSVEWGTAVRLLAGTMGLLLLSAVVGVLRRTFRCDALARAVSLGVNCALFLTVVGTLYGQLQKVVAFLDRLNVLVNSLLPLMSALHLTGGNVAVAAAQHSGLMMFLSVCEHLCNRTVIPLTGICLALTVAATFSPAHSLKGLTGLIKSTYTKALGFVMLLLSFVLSVQTVLRAASDSLTARAAKFLAGNVIPVVGGALGDTLRTVASGVTFLKSTVGVGAMVVLFAMLVPVLCSLLLTRLSLRLCLTVSDLLGCGDESRLLGELVGIYGTLIAVVSLCSVLLIFALTLFVRVAVAM